MLDKYGILAEATATARTSAERYTFPGGAGHILLNLGEGIVGQGGTEKLRALAGIDAAGIAAAAKELMA